MIKKIKLTNENDIQFRFWFKISFVSFFLLSASKKFVHFEEEKITCVKNEEKRKKNK